ncbi:MAG: hypothetical protein V4494_07535 [Chlamydiota bacterium]
MFKTYKEKQEPIGSKSESNFFAAAYSQMGQIGGLAHAIQMLEQEFKQKAQTDVNKKNKNHTNFS